jgi:hypothetical protein
MITVLNQTQMFLSVQNLHDSRLLSESLNGVSWAQVVSRRAEVRDGISPCVCGTEIGYLKGFLERRVRTFNLEAYLLGVDCATSTVGRVCGTSRARTLTYT